MKNTSQPHDTRFSELLDQNIESNEALLDEMMDLATHVEAALQNMTDEHFVSQALLKYPQAPKSDMVSKKFLHETFSNSLVESLSINNQRATSGIVKFDRDY